MFPLSAEEVTQAKMLIQRFVRTELYPTETPTFKISMILHSTFFPGGFFQTDLPDGMLYYVRKDVDRPLTLTAYKKVEEVNEHYT